MVLGAVEDHEDEGFGRVRLQTVPDTSGKSLNNFIKTHIEPGSSVRTNGWRGYSKVGEFGYEHIVSGGGDSEEAVGEDPSPPLCHRVISLLKQSLLNPYQGAIHPAQLDRYLEEFAFRFNRSKSKSRGLLFLRLLQHVVRIPPFPAKEIQLGLRDYMRGTRKNKIVPNRDVFRPVDISFLDQLDDLPF